MKLKKLKKNWKKISKKKRETVSKWNIRKQIREYLKMLLFINEFRSKLNLKSVIFVDVCKYTSEYDGKLRRFKSLLVTVVHESRIYPC